VIHEVNHVTTYYYGEPVSICHNEVHLIPRDFHDGSMMRQSVLHNELFIEPEPDVLVTRQDYFGNSVSYFSIHESHQKLTVAATSVVETRAESLTLSSDQPWEEARDLVHDHTSPEALNAFQFTLESPLVSLQEQFAEYAEASFGPHRPLYDAVRDLNRRIYHDFRYDPAATTIATPVDEVLARRHGVCQDFAHVMLCCLRSLGLASRYVSGYLRNDPKLVGAAESHAWVSVYFPELGWLDFDPTNNLMPQDGHFTLGWGRDYSDVTPTKGVALGGGDHTLHVSVHVTPRG
jgi:transglutaminase-like putative cysteine protease